MSVNMNSMVPSLKSVSAAKLIDFCGNTPDFYEAITINANPGLFPEEYDSDARHMITLLRNSEIIEVWNDNAMLWNNKEDCPVQYFIDQALSDVKHACRFLHIVEDNYVSEAEKINNLTDFIRHFRGTRSLDWREFVIIDVILRKESLYEDPIREFINQKLQEKLGDNFYEKLGSQESIAVIEEVVNTVMRFNDSNRFHEELFLEMKRQKLLLTNETPYDDFKEMLAKNNLKYGIGYTLYHAMKKDDPETVLQILILANLNKIDPSGYYGGRARNVLPWALRKGHLTIAEHILASENINNSAILVKSSLYGALDEASDNGYLDIAKRLLDIMNANTDSPYLYLYGALCKAANNGYLEIAEQILSVRKAYIPENYLNEPLRLALKNGYLDIAKLMLSWEKANNRPVSKLQVSDFLNTVINNKALEGENAREMIKLILSLKDAFYFTQSLEKALCWAVKKGYADIVELIFSVSCACMFFPPDLQSIFGDACEKGCVDIVKLFLDFNNAGRMRYAMNLDKALMLVCEKERVDIVKLFLDSENANNISSEVLESVFIAASQKGWVEIDLLPMN